MGVRQHHVSAGRAPGGDAVILLDEDLINLVGERAPDHRARETERALGRISHGALWASTLRRQPPNQAVWLLVSEVRQRPWMEEE
jgi:hypothetical protein